MKKFVILLMVFCFLFLYGCKKNSDVNNKVTKGNYIVCDRSIYPLVNELVENYNVNTKESVELKLVDSLDNFKSKIKNEEIIISYKNSKITSKNKVELGTDGIAMVVNKNKKISNINTDKLNDIYSGVIRRWTELNGESLNLDIVLYNGIYSFVESYVKDKVDSKIDSNFKNEFVHLNDIEAIKKKVKNNEETLAFIPMMHLGTEEKTLNLNGVMLNKNNIKNGLYEMVVPIYMYYGDELSSSLNEFIIYVKSDNGKNIIKKYCVDKNS
ncbi:substrate-binding domain-containing protein [Haloimpatiens sp. FM7315]|uniref:substrate-binding domain-containing protein n=1 Tax=Haloimpatiens sp. FM7315 TaxID=3298609 RepID=UPI00370AF127